jgi:hypothetical protein
MDNYVSDHKQKHLLAKSHSFHFVTTATTGVEGKS